MLFNKKKNKKLEQKAQELLKKWEEGDKRTLLLWRLMNNWALEGFEKTYKKFGIKFDENSDFNTVINNNISNNKNCGIYFNDAGANQIIGNDICNNLADGIFFYESSGGNEIQGNNIKFNGKTGVVINENNIFNLLINNNFSRNQIHAEDNGTFTASYSARCDKCGLKHNFEHSEQVKT